MPTSYPANDPAFRMEKGVSTSSMKLLVVEDNEDDQELLLRKLRKANITDHILFVNDGRKAIDLLSQHGSTAHYKIFAVFLDLKLKGSSGFEVLRLIRSKPRLEKLPVIVMTGSSDPLDRKECERLKVTGFLSKPIQFESFCMALANVFHQPATPSAPHFADAA